MYFWELPNYGDSSWGAKRAHQELDLNFSEVLGVGRKEGAWWDVLHLVHGGDSGVEGRSVVAGIFPEGLGGEAPSRGNDDG